MEVKSVKEHFMPSASDLSSIPAITANLADVLARPCLDIKQAKAWLLEAENLMERIPGLTWESFGLDEIRHNSLLMHIEHTRQAYTCRAKKTLAATLGKNISRSMGPEDADTMLGVAKDLKRGIFSAAEVGFTESSLRYMADWVLTTQDQSPLLA